MKLISLLSRFTAAAAWLQSPLLLVLRLYWGLQFVQTGFGKLTHLAGTTSYFADLGIPLPGVNAALAGATECGCGALLAAGLLARVAAVPLIVTMAVAYLTAEHAALAAIWRNPDGFTSATPFLYLLASLVVLSFGPGAFSLDRLLGAEQPARRPAT